MNEYYRVTTESPSGYSTLLQSDILITLLYIVCETSINRGYMNVVKKLKFLNRQRNLKTKILKYKIKSFLLSLGYRKRTSINKNEYKTVCIFMHTQAIGDGIVTSGLINELRKTGMKVYVVIPDKLSFLFPDMIFVDGVILFENESVSSIKRNIGSLLIDLVIDISDYDNAISLREETIKYLNPKHAIGFNQPKYTVFDTNVMIKESEHITRRMSRVLALLDISSNCHSSLAITDDSFKNAHDFADSFEDKKIIIFNPFAAHENRCLNVSQINCLLDYLNSLSDYITIVFDMGRGIECDKFERIKLNPFGDAGHSFALVSCADVVISVDTAIVHLASALNIKQYCIYNNRSFNGIYDNNVVWAPNSDKADVLTTNEHSGTESGDDIKKFDMNVIISLLKRDLNS